MLMTIRENFQGLGRWLGHLGQGLFVVRKHFFQIGESL